jgi:hypothetical protein
LKFLKSGPVAYLLHEESRRRRQDKVRIKPFVDYLDTESVPGCAVWTGKLDRRGRPAYRASSTTEGPAAYYYARVIDKRDGWDNRCRARQTCATVGCVRHWELVHPRVELTVRTEFTEEERDKIWRMWDAGKSIKGIAASVAVSCATITRVLTRG